jgi:IS5 family transposase
VLEREMRANLVYCDFTRVGGGKVPDAKTMGRWGVAAGPLVLEQVHASIATTARESGAIAGADCACTRRVLADIHYPSDSSLLGDGVRVLTRTMKKIAEIAGAGGTELRERSRSVQLRVLEIARAARAKGQSQERLKSVFSRLLHAASRVVGQAKRFAEEIATGVKRPRTILKQMALEGLRAELETKVPLIKQVTKQTRARIFRGETRRMQDPDPV